MNPPLLLSVVVPAYNEADTIVLALERLRTELDLLDAPYEVLLVSDGSNDGTDASPRGVDFPQLTVFHYEPNQGKGHALRYGAARATGEMVAFIDADLDIHPSCIRTLLDQLRATGVDAVIGSKVHPDSEVVYPAFRRFQSRMFRLLIHVMFDLEVSDTQTGCKVFRRELLDTCLARVESTGFALDLELLVLANDAGFRVTEGPIRLDYQFSTSTGARAVVDMLRDVRALAQRRRRARRAGTWITPRRG